MLRNIISASRRTDIPHYYPKWFAQRRKEGIVEFRNAFGGKGSISLKNQDIIGFLFWTRYAFPFNNQLELLRYEGLPYAFQYTVNNYARDLEPYTPKLHRTLDDFLSISMKLPAPECIQWRYDPIILSTKYNIEFHVKAFKNIANALAGATKVVNTAFVEPYLKAVRRLHDTSILYRKVDPQRHKTVARKFPHLAQLGNEAQYLLNELTQIASENDIELRVCSNPEWPSLRARCCGSELFSNYGEDIAKAVGAIKQAPSRDGCRCLKSVDIGMDNTCISGCKYCYVVQSHKVSVKNRQSHDCMNVSLR